MQIGTALGSAYHHCLLSISLVDEQCASGWYSGRVPCAPKLSTGKHFRIVYTFVCLLPQKQQQGRTCVSTTVAPHFVRLHWHLNNFWYEKHLNVDCTCLYFHKLKGIFTSLGCSEAVYSCLTGLTNKVFSHSAVLCFPLTAESEAHFSNMVSSSSIPPCINTDNLWMTQFD